MSKWCFVFTLPSWLIKPWKKSFSLLLFLSVCIYWYLLILWSSMAHHKTLSAKCLIATCCCLLETRGIFWSLKLPQTFIFPLHIFDTDYTPMQRRSADIALQTPLQKRLTSTLNDVLYWKEEGGEIFHALIVWFWDFLGTQWVIYFLKSILISKDYANLKNFGPIWMIIDKFD